MSAPTIEVSQALLNSSLFKRMENQPDLSDAEIEAMCSPSTGAAPARKPNYLKGFVPGAYGALRRLRAEGRKAMSFTTRRKRGGDGRLPDKIRCEYTEGHRAVLSVIGEQVAKTGSCSLSIELLMKRAGVKVRTVQYALRRAQTLGHIVVKYRPQRSGKSLTNVVRIIASDWLAWLRPKAKTIKDTGCKEVHTYEINNNNTLFSSQNQAQNQPKVGIGLRKGSGGRTP